MLESLLERVRRRAAEPRQGAVVIPPLNVPRFDASPAAAKTSARAQPQPVPVEEELEEYEDELIEIIDDGESAPESPPEPRPLELSASAPSVEMRRRILPPSLSPTEVAAPAPSAPRPAAPARAVSSTASGVTEPLRAEVVARKPVAAAAVAHSLGVRRDARAASFAELLDASLKLGS
jgi:hypothetical protein